ncbi:hypothetical protein JOF28_002298 [Leucobacter exalbidus]|uniref:Uncharacterized protein n=1 Tax=Leucobacter exalbidus TaxID=662960 RepID=A0A940PXT5_9MICO|nr:hypothetical protein [Leucobacter exalbidus]MBP1327066.1 hypothetical protein [Leucobacter exalbidus]
MTNRRWYLAAGLVALLAVAVGSCTAWTQREIPPVRDAAGVTEVESQELTVREQFDLVHERYELFNDQISVTMSQIHPGEWKLPNSSNGAMVMEGNAFRGALKGEGTAANSYYLSRFWRLDDVANGEAKLREAKQRWEELGWKTEMYDSDIYPGEYRASAITSDGAWIALDMLRDGLNVTAYSGVYWGDTETLRRAIWNIQQSERDEGTRWRPEKIDDNSNGYLMAGEYPPFPEWRAAALGPRLPDSRD